ncbi:MAG: hypothetical protein QW614_01870 [Candidatus Caldarchaeum sp.]|uniref:DUF3782 domain-containing protein n=1 Tax=Caldiarchaeum subterraneum TaxID=311458 RepID=A0A7C5QCP9_CALS0
MAGKLRREFIELLEKDEEFRYTVAGYLGLSEILKELKNLREGQSKLWEEVRSFRERQEAKRVWNYVSTAFSELKSALGVTFEMRTAAYIELILYEMGYVGARVEKKCILHKDEILEIDLFSENPLVVGEVIALLKDAASASREVEKLLTRVRAVEEKYGLRPVLTVLSVATASKQAAEKLVEEAERHGFRLVLGKEIEEALQI